MSIEKRKNNHIEICLEKDVRSKITNGFEQYRLIHNALPEADFAEMKTESIFLGKKISAPFLISSMTGGTESGEQINRNLAEAAAAMGLPFAIGSQRIYLTAGQQNSSKVRDIAPNIPVLANIGAVQLNYGFTREHLLRAVEMLEADALILHCNPLQELMQAGGDTDFSGLLKKIEEICSCFPVPVVIKEVGWGINADLAGKLWNAGVSMIDTAGAGGTSWSQVESLCRGTEYAEELAAPFVDWGIPTAECVRSIHEAYPEIPLIASGGIMNGVEAAKAILLGAQMCGMAARLLPAAASGTSEDVCRVLNQVIIQYKIARFVSCGIERKTAENGL